jgi:hypothetical protein
MSCLPCIAGWHNECVSLIFSVDLSTDDAEVFLCCCSEKSTVTIAPEGRQLKSNEEIRDVESTGRKRAAQAKPIVEGMICEWANLKFAGGGVLPVVGCAGNIASDRHHGPDKSTLNNSAENLHAICDHCHNRWHTLNDPFYPKERPANGAPFLPLTGEPKAHDPITKATPEEVAANEKRWSKK